MGFIRIKNVGSIKEVEIEIKKVNVFIGPQATGKSTIAKIISQALWAEKNYLTTSEEYDFYKGLLSFHNMDRNYFNASEIFYESSWCIIQMVYEEGKRYPRTYYKRKKNKELYQNSKIEYIPSERNFVASVNNIGKYTSSNNSTYSFLLDWYNAKSSYQRSKHFDIELPDLEFSYRYKESEERDIIRMNNGTEVELQSGSSGQQSLLPMLLVATEVLKNTYDEQKIFSPIELAHIKKKASDLAPIVDLLGQLGRSSRKTILEQLDKLWHKIGYIGDYGCTHLVVEEPEQNLYPSTQRGLLQHLIYLLISEKRSHSLTITTHSPYILYALDNCMLAGWIKSKKGAGYLERLPNRYAEIAIDPNDVGMWYLKDGKVLSLQDDTRHLLDENIFNEELQVIHNEMYDLLSLIEYGDEV